MGRSPTVAAVSAGRQLVADETTAFLPGAQGLLRPELQPELGISNAAVGRPGLGQPSGSGSAPGQQGGQAWVSVLQASRHGHASLHRVWRPVIKAGGPALKLAPLCQSQAMGIAENGAQLPHCSLPPALGPAPLPSGGS